MMLNATTFEGDNTMTYQEYVAAYESLLNKFFGYTSNEVGSLMYAEKLSDLEEAYPQYEAQREAVWA